MNKMRTKQLFSKVAKSSTKLCTVLATVFYSAKSIFKFKIFKNEGQEMLFVAIGTLICYLILLVLEIKELMQ